MVRNDYERGARFEDMNRNNQIGRNGPDLVSIDLRGNATTRLSVRDRDAATETTVTRYPTSTTPATEVSSNGLLVASTSQTGVTTTCGYDELERQVEVKSARHQ